jgi:hypothetical protein
MALGSTLTEGLSHPFVILIAGALITSYVIPRFTRKWQDHQKELELKMGLVSKISEDVTAIVMAVQFVLLTRYLDEVTGERRRARQKELDDAYREWEINSSVIESQLMAYYPDAGIWRDWRRFSEVVTDFYALLGWQDNERKTDRIRALLESLSSAESCSHRAAVETEPEKSDQGHNLWVSLRYRILERKNEIIQCIMNTPIHVFNR